MEEDKYCIYCHIKVKPIVAARTFVGKEQPQAYIHVSLRTPSGDVSCGRRELIEEEVEPLTDADEA